MQDEHIKKVVSEDTEIDEKTKQTLIEYFDFASARYFRLRKALIIFVSIVSVGCAVGIWQGHQAAIDATSALTQFKKDTVVRRNQSCTLQERSYIAKIKELEGTYKYLDALKPGEAQSTLNQFIIRGLPKQRADLALEVAPDFCYEPGIGLKNKKPKLPLLKDYSHLLLPMQQK